MGLELDLGTDNLSGLYKHYGLLFICHTVYITANYSSAMSPFWK